MSMSQESLKNRLERDLAPSGGAKERIWKRISTRLDHADSLSSISKVLEPEDSVKDRIWARILNRIDVPESSALLDKLRELLAPPAGLRGHLHKRFSRVPVHVTVRRQYTIKWVAAFIIFALFVKAGPQLFIVPSTIADSKVTLMPTRGEVTISVGGFWQPVNEEVVLEPGTLLRTHDGEASIVFRDDGVLRLDEWTTVQVHDTSDPVQIDEYFESTLTLITGRIWLQGLVPSPLKGINVRTDYGLIKVQEGSVSIQESEKTVDVEIWDRRTHVTQGDKDVFLVAGEQTRLSEGGILFVKKIFEDRYEDNWVVQNLKRDAVHRRYIAQLQQERRAARARILPTSILYPAKRIAEKVDVLLTFGEEAKTQKKLDQASTRLDEVAALIKGGATDAAIIPLEDYRDSLITMATGSGNELVQMLIQESIAIQAGQVAAALPDDDAYLIKKAVLEAGTQLPKKDGGVSLSDVQGVLLLDTITALIQKVDREGPVGLGETWEGLREQLAVLDNEANELKPEVRKEARMLLSEFAFILSDMYARGETVDPLVVTQVYAYLPPQTEDIPVLSDEEVNAIVQGIRDRIFIYHMQKPRINQLVSELKALDGHPDQGRILRKLRFALPGGPEEFPLKVRKEIIRLQWARVAG